MFDYQPLCYVIFLFIHIGENYPSNIVHRLIYLPLCYLHFALLFFFSLALINPPPSSLGPPGVNFVLDNELVSLMQRLLLFSFRARERR